MNRAQENVTNTDKAVQDEADNYVKNAKATTYAANDADIDSYIANSADQNNAVNKLRGTGAVSADRFKSKQDLTMANVDQLQTDAGVQEALRNEGGADYNAGMGAFDLAALRRTPGFDQIRANLLTQRDATRKKADEYGNTKTAEAQAAMDANLASAKSGLKSGLESRETAMEAALKAKADAANQAATAGRAGDISKQAMDARLEAMGQTPQEMGLSYYLDNAKVDPNQFYQDQTTDWHDLIGQDDASKFNNIMAGLGRSDADSQFTAGGGAKSNKFDKGAYENALLSAAQGQQGKDQQAKASQQAAVDLMRKNAEIAKNTAEHGATDQIIARNAAAKAANDAAAKAAAEQKAREDKRTLEVGGVKSGVTREDAEKIDQSGAANPEGDRPMSSSTEMQKLANKVVKRIPAPVLNRRYY